MGEQTVQILDAKQRVHQPAIPQKQARCLDQTFAHIGVPGGQTAYQQQVH
jgi:hypothetical protein